MRDRLDPTSLAAGLGLIGLGGLLLLDTAGSLELSGGVLGALVAAVVGAILVVDGLFDDEH